MDNRIVDDVNNTHIHIDFLDLAEYVFSNGRGSSFLKKAATINYKVMECPECYQTYLALTRLRDHAEQYVSLETSSEKLLIKLLRFFLTESASSTVEQLVNECSRFKAWISFNIKSMKELVQTSNQGFSNPRLVTVMNSSTGKGEEVKSVIRSSLVDKNKNRVTIGLDGTLSLYFDSNVYSEGKRVVVVPDDDEAEPVMIELQQYDDSISYVRFEGIKPGKYTVMIEK